MNGNNFRKKNLIGQSEDSIPHEDQLIKFTPEAAGIVVESNKTDENDNKILNCVNPERYISMMKKLNIDKLAEGNDSDSGEGNKFFQISCSVPPNPASISTNPPTPSFTSSPSTFDENDNKFTLP